MTRFQNKQELQHYLESMLEAWDVPYEYGKVSSPNGQLADLVLPNAVVQIRTILDCSTLYQALEQGRDYQSFMHKPRLLVVGQAPFNPREYRLVRGIVEYLTRQSEVKVIFIEGDGCPALARWLQLLPGRHRATLDNSLRGVSIFSRWSQDELAVVLGIIAATAIWMIWAGLS